MTDEAKRIVDELKNYAKQYADTTCFWKHVVGTAEIMRDAADMIEELLADLDRAIEDDNFQRNHVVNLYEQMNQLIQQRDEWQQRAEAAQRDINKVSMYYPCAVCKHWHLGGCKLAADLNEPNWKCDRDTNRFEWRGPCTENGGGDNGNA